LLERKQSLGSRLSRDDRTSSFLVPNSSPEHDQALLLLLLLLSAVVSHDDADDTDVNGLLVA